MNIEDIQPLIPAHEPDGYFWMALAIVLFSCMIWMVVEWFKNNTKVLGRLTTIMEDQREMISELKTMVEVHETEIEEIKNKLNTPLVTYRRGK